MFRTLNGNGYARCDYRMDATGAIYMLEINPNCGIFYPPTDPGSADFCLLHDKINHRKFMKMIIRSALQRQARARSKAKQKVEKKEMAYA
jgi:D-alanine-D-alanine ligase